MTGRLVSFVVKALALTGCAGDGASSATPVPLTWEIVQELGDVYVDSLVATPAGVFGLQRELWDESDGRGGLWLSGDGRSFEFVESDELFGRDASIELLTAGGPDLVAAGFLPSAEGHRVVVWTSPDGRDWTAVDTGYIAVAGVGMGLQMMAIAARPQGAVILAWEGEFFTVHDAKEVEEQIRGPPAPRTARPRKPRLRTGWGWGARRPVPGVGTEPRRRRGRSGAGGRLPALGQRREIIRARPVRHGRLRERGKYVAIAS